jgi:rubrerythrin
MAEVRTCDTCNTPLDAEGACVTCRAVGQGLVPLSRSGYASVREMLELLEEQDLAAEIEQVPPRRPEEAARPLWNLYIPKDQLAQAQAFLRKDWAELLEQPEAAEAAERGLTGVDLDAGGEITCPACGHRFVAVPGKSDCPDCGLSLGAPADSAPDEAEH